MVDAVVEPLEPGVPRERLDELTGRCGRGGRSRRGADAGRVSRRRVGVVGVKSLPAGYQPLMSAMRLVAEEV